MKISSTSILVLSLVLLVQSYQLNGQSDESPLRLHQIQLIGTHNSYKLPMDAAIMQQLLQIDKAQGLALDYGHLPLDEQLDMGVRVLEIDVLHDPQGGRFLQPYGISVQDSLGLAYTPVDTLLMSRPGFKVMHVQDIDFRSSCVTFKNCLTALNNWSKLHPGHLPVFVSINAKEGGIPRPGFTTALPFNPAVFDSLDQEILSVLGAEQVISPDEIRAGYGSLREAVKAKNWPLLDDARGKFIFILDGDTRQTADYTAGHPSLRGRLMFAATDPQADEAAILFINQPIGMEDSIQKLVAEGFVVRTRADANTLEARNNDYSRLAAALQAGAHLISTDYVLPNPAFKNAYQIRFPDGTLFRCHPLTTKGDCPSVLESN